MRLQCPLTLLLLAAGVLVGCDRQPPMVAVPVPVEAPVVIQGPAGQPGPAGPAGSSGATGAAGMPGDSTVIVVPTPVPASGAMK